ncbi:Putative HotDog domain superfamily protein [Acrodontium crateriforme]|uniref:HotDog domain superfamily protein n=1 Tax=Acrodontium crateriforme TaxID=150365 RepID=A0AAQ3RCL6_9PEZI|nr:Putative HotDog domain superfamily protein [Acrodontium crateriforme]
MRISRTPALISVISRPGAILPTAQPPLRKWSSHETSPTPATASLSPRWLADVKKRIGHCITFGLTPTQTTQAGKILNEIASDWRELIAGSEGYLTSRERRSIYRQQVVWGEMDSMGHVNNVVYNRYAESGRVQWTQKYGNFIDPANRAVWSNLMTPSGMGLILRAITTEFKFPMTWPDHISIYHKLRKEPVRGDDAFILDVVILSELHQRPAARCIEDIVVYDYQKAKKTPMKPFMVDVFRETWRLQEEAKRVNNERVNGLLRRVRELETSSWDREGAAEDMGSAGS